MTQLFVGLLGGMGVVLGRWDGGWRVREVDHGGVCWCYSLHGGVLRLSPPPPLTGGAFSLFLNAFGVGSVDTLSNHKINKYYINK